jgi:hypothetical protein
VIGNSLGPQQRRRETVKLMQSIQRLTNPESKSSTSTGYFSNSTGSSVSNCRFSLIIEPNYVSMFMILVIVCSYIKTSTNQVRSITSTSRRHREKKPQSFSHCGSFNHPDLQSLNDFIFLFLFFATVNLKFWGHVI